MRIVRIAGGVIGAAVLLTGCWAQPGFGPANTRYNDVETGLTAANVDGLSQQWSTEARVVSFSEPVIRGRQVFTTGSHPAEFLGIKAFDARTGELDWEAQVNGVRGGAGPVTLAGDEVSISHNPGFCETAGISRFSQDGGLLSHVETLPWGHEVTGSGVVADVRIPGCSSPAIPAVLVVRDASTLDQLWAAELPGTNNPGSDMTPTVAGDRIYVAVGSNLVAYPLGCGTGTCAPLWSRVFIGASLGRPTVGANGRVHVVAITAEGHDAHDINPADGTSYGHGAWETVRLALTANHVLQVISIGPDVGVGWVNPDYTSPGDAMDGACLFADSRPIGVAVGGDVIYVATAPASGNGDGALVAIPAASPGTGGAPCEVLRTLPVPGTPTSVSVGGGRVLVASQTGDVTSAITAYGLE